MESNEHARIVKLIADKCKKPGSIVLWNYANAAIGEEPDVFVFCRNGKTILYEVKVSLADFIRDRKKAPRKHGWMAIGSERYFVCPHGLISSEDAGGWGLIYAKGNRIKVVKDSVQFQRIDWNLERELKLLAHAFRKYAATGGECNIHVNTAGF